MLLLVEERDGGKTCKRLSTVEPEVGSQPGLAEACGGGAWLLPHQHTVFRLKKQVHGSSDTSLCWVLFSLRRSSWPLLAVKHAVSSGEKCSPLSNNVALKAGNKEEIWSIFPDERSWLSDLKTVVRWNCCILSLDLRNPQHTVMYVCAF